MSDECKLPAVLDCLSGGPCKGATGWSTRTLLSLWWSDPGRNDHGTAAGGADREDSNTAPPGRSCTPAHANTTAARNTAAASSNASRAVAVGGDSIFSGSRATAAAATIHATRSRSVRLTSDSRKSSSVYISSDAGRDLAVCTTRDHTAFAGSGDSGAPIRPIVYAAGSTTPIRPSVYAAGCGTRIRPIVYTAASAARVCPIVYAAASAASYTPAASATGPCCLVDGRQSIGLASAR